jgi:hypothetical protein
MMRDWKALTQRVVQNYTEIIDKTIVVGNMPSETIQTAIKEYYRINAKEKWSYS